MKNIIVPIDFSDDSINSLKYAINLANKVGAQVEMIFVQRKKNLFNPLTYEKECEYVNKHMNELIEQNKGLVSGDTKINYTTRKGKVYIEVNKFADEFPDSLIVASCFGISGYDENFIGSNALKIVSHSSCPVILLRSYDFAKDINTIIMPLDMSLETKQKVPVTIDIASQYSSKVHLVDISAEQVNDIRFRLRLDSNEVSHYLKKNKIEHDTELLIGKNFSKVIIKYATKKEADLIVAMSEHDRKESKLIGPNALQLVQNSEIPILIVPSKE
jgi:nucleotide-binding universal stress UspA family protein